MNCLIPDSSAQLRDTFSAWLCKTARRVTIISSIVDLIASVFTRVTTINVLSRPIIDIWVSQLTCNWFSLANTMHSLSIVGQDELSRTFK